MARKQLTKERILEATLKLIEEKGSSNAINFREIARELGCAHTSLYNFYDSFQEIKLDAVRLLVVNMRSELAQRTSLIRSESESIIVTYSAAVIDYALEHKGWYRFLWMDYMEHSISEALRNQPRPEKLLMKALIEEYELHLKPLPEADAITILQVGHAYTHGELCKYLSNRSEAADESDFKNEVIKNVQWIGRNYR